MTPTLNEIRNYDPNWLLNAHQSWTRLGKAWEDTFAQAHRSVVDLPWEGEGAEAAVQAHLDDLNWVRGKSDQLGGVAKTAFNSYHDLIAQKNDLIAQVDSITNQGFKVAPDFTVTPDTKDPITFTAKLSAASTATAQLKAAAAALIAHDGEVGATLTAAGATFTPQHKPGEPQNIWVNGRYYDWISSQHDDPNWGNYDPNHPTPNTPYEYAHNGSNFNEPVKLDTSVAASRGPLWGDPSRDVYGQAPGDARVLAGGTPSAPPPFAPMDQPDAPTGGTKPFLPKWQQEITNPAGGPQSPPLQIQTPNGTLNLLPPARDFPPVMPQVPPNPFRDLNPNMPPVPPGAGIGDGVRDGLRRGLPELTPPSYPVNQPPPPLQTNGYNGGGQIQPMDYTRPLDTTPSPSPVPHLACTPEQRQDELIKDLGRKMIIGAMIGGVTGGVPTEGIGALPGAIDGALGGGLMWLFTSNGQGQCP
jgi:hypothetical protein